MASPVEKRTIDVLSAAAFLEEAAGPLHRALARPGCDHSLVQAIRHQERLHGLWLALVGTAHRGGNNELVCHLERLYGFHGRVAGRLERGFHPLLQPSAEEQVRLLLIQQLQRLTARAVAHLLAHTASARPGGGSWASAGPCGWPRRGERPRR